MNDDKHAPTDEFVEYLARDTMRRLRYETRFAEAPRVNHSRSRFTTLAVAAGVVVTLSTGMVLGASANYASAEVLPNGTTMIPSRPTLAILPIKNALSAIGCTQPAEHGVASTNSNASMTATASTAASAVALPKSDAAAIDQVAAPTVNQNPDRAMVALLARQHQSAVVRGDTTSDYIVMVLDAAQNYLWSTHGSGNVSVEVGGDTRTAAERAAYDRTYATELGGTNNLKMDFVLDSTPRSLRIFYTRDTLNAETFRTYRVQAAGDSSQRWFVRDRLVDSAVKVRARDGAGAGAGAGAAGVGRGGGRGGGAGGGGGGRANASALADTGTRRYQSFVFVKDSGGGSGTRYNISANNRNAACSRGAVQLFSRLNGAGGDSASSTYTARLAESRLALRCNQAAGLQQRGAGESGIAGLPSANVAKTDAYMFSAGELAPRDLKVLVVYLTPGTYWSGR